MTSSERTDQPFRVLVLGGGTAGFLSALTLRKRLPDHVKVTVLHSSKLGIIGVGEGSLRQLPDFLHNYLGIDAKRFFDEVGPTWKLGINFKWGGRGDFNYTFAPQVDVCHPHPDLPRPIGFYCHEQMENHCVASVMMRNNLVYLRDQQGRVDMQSDFGYHLENQRFAAFLERYAVEQGIELLDDFVTQVKMSDQGVEGLLVESGEFISADVFIDCSGFASILLEKHLHEPFVPYTDTLFCDKAVIGGWVREDEPIRPYTISESMDNGWCWQIEHKEHINRGYVYSSSFATDEAAEAEFRTRNPKIEETNIVRFRSGRFERAWVKNVVAIGNSAGFVEPLEATAIAAICSVAKAAAETLAGAVTNNHGHITDAYRQQFNLYNARSWDKIADFLAVHYRFNTRLETPFWDACRNDVDLRGATPIVEYYQQNGPDSSWRLTLEDPICRFRLDGYYTLLIGQGVPHAAMDTVTQSERDAFKKLQAATAAYGSKGLDTRAALARVNKTDWQWQPQHFAA